MAAGVIAGGTVASAVERPTGHAGEPHGGQCSDCGAEVSGKFCANCGLPTHVHRTLLHLLHELLHGVMHFDGRIWRTLPLLIGNPGKLTREWCEGKRVRYVSPLAIFLFTLFVIFFGLSFAPSPNVKPEQVGRPAVQVEDRELLQSRLAETKAELASLEARFPETRGSERMEVGIRMGTLSGLVATLEGQQQAAISTDEYSDANRNVRRTDGLEPGSWQAQVADLNIDANDKGLEYKLKKKLKNPELFLYKLQQTAYKFAFLLVPLSIPFMWLLFLWRRGSTLYDHGVFVLYSLTFMAMLTLVAGLLTMAASGQAGVIWLIVSLIIPVHMFAQLKGAYSLSVFSALWRLVLLQFFCAIVVSLFILAIVYLGVG